MLKTFSVNSSSEDADTASELLVVGVFEGSTKDSFTFGLANPKAAQTVNLMTNGMYRQLAEMHNFAGKLGQTLLGHDSKQHIAKPISAPRFMLMGLGKAKQLTKARLREALVAVFKKVKQLDVSSLTFGELSLTGSKISSSTFAHMVTETAGLVGYTINHFKTELGGHKSKKQLSEIKLLISAKNNKRKLDLAFAALDGMRTAQAVNLARDLVNTPASILTPLRLAEQAERVAAESNGQIKIRLIHKPELVQMGANCFLAVSHGSLEPPVLIEMSYLPEKADPSVTLAYVGKSVTFDSGGLDLKPADGMRNMKCDMAGGAATLAAIKAIAAMQLPVRLKVYMAATENMVGNKPFKPGDVITSMKGLTVEIDNTDAEGRLTLVDAIEFAKRQGATHIVDIATLTGAVRTCCGSVGAGAFSNNKKLLADVLSSSTQAGELLAALPFWDELAKANETDIADIKNSGGAAFGAGSATAAHFIKSFVGDTPWVHIDIASVAYRANEWGYDPKGATGWGVMTLIELAKKFSKRKKYKSNISFGSISGDIIG